MKKIIFLIIACLLVLGPVLSGCDGGPEIIIAVVGPLSSGIEGRHMWWGANLSRNQINQPTAGQPGVGNGIKVGATTYNIRLLYEDIADPNHSGPVATMDDAIAKGAQFIIGGWYGDAVAQMIPVARTNKVPFFIDGAATYSQLSGTAPYPSGTGTPYYPYSSYVNYDPGYKYIFRGTPINDVFLANNAFLMTTMVAKRIECIIGSQGYDGNMTNPVKIAILAENLPWTTQFINSAERIFGTVAPSAPPDGLGWPWQLVGTWRVTDTESYADVQTKLNEIKAAGAQVIFTIMSGPVGLTFGKAMGAVGVPAIPVGINVEAQYPGYWLGTEYETGKYGANYEITTATWAPGVAQEGTQTTNFLNDFQGWTGNINGEFPIFTAASYDIIYDIKAAMEGSESIDKDDIIEWLEAPEGVYTDTTGQRAYYPRWDGSTTGKWEWTLPWDNSDWPALTNDQVTAIYLSAGHDVGVSNSCNFTMPPYTTHDLIYGPTWEIGIGSQWLDDGMGNGERVGVWPNKDDYLTDQDKMSRAFAGINWTDVEYEGTEDFEISQWMIDEWTE